MTTTETKTNGGTKVETKPEAKAPFGAKKGEPRPATTPYTATQAYGKIKNILARVADPEQKKKTIAAVAALTELG